MKDKKKLRKEIFYKERENLLQSLRSSYELYDKYLLALSSGGLGISLSFIENIVPLEKANFKIILIISWILFILSIIFTLISFITSQKSTTKQLHIAQKYYLEEDDTAYNEKDLFNKATEYLNYFSGLIFLFAVILTVIFISINILR